MTPRKRDKFEDRVRFNWGFHDATADAAHGWKPVWAGKPHFDPVYEAGYQAGIADYQATGVRNPSSEVAWVAYKAGRTLVRAALRDPKP